MPFKALAASVANQNIETYNLEWSNTTARVAVFLQRAFGEPSLPPTIFQQVFDPLPSPLPPPPKEPPLQGPL